MTTSAAGPRLSVILITLDEEERLPACLASVAGLADEIVVVDTGSRDRTVEIAQRAGARVDHIARAGFKGHGISKQRALDLATGAWVLLLDADERVTRGLADEIRATLAGDVAVDGYWVRRDVYYLGRRMRWGGLGHDWVIRLFRREKGRCTPAPVHTGVEVDGMTARLKGTIEHHTVRTVPEHLRKVENYGSIRTAEFAARGRRYRATDWLRMPVEFVLRAFVRLGVLDGTRGIVWATISAYEKWLRYAMLINRPPDRGGGDR
ncbi:MAG TPA: glycosyltransferase family 2 protein [Gemmatimonadales bacterium]|nr:glycosyltransferase family 2 protein [Gemmatimonadales bacterium]